MADRVGQQFGQYRLSQLLGQGSFGEVYLGEHVYNHTLAAVKVLEARLTAEDLKEFIDEASTTLRLQHPHIVRLLDFGIGPADTPFLVMAYAANGTLRKLHPKGTRLPLESIIAYVSPIAAALQHAHDERLIHRDVKPENILLGPNNEVWLSDFGITSVAHSTRSVNTEKPGGTVPYMAPEQLRGKARPASDQYALGIMVYEWLCGERPFSGTATEIAMQHLLEPPPSLREKVATISPDVEHVVMTALAKDPASRFASVQAFATALEAAADVQPRLHPGSARTSGDSVSGGLTSSMDAPVDEASPTVQTNEQHVPTLPPTGPSAETVPSSSIAAPVNGASPTVQTSEQHVPTLPSQVPSTETMTSEPPLATSSAPDGTTAAQTPPSIIQGKKSLPSVFIPPGFLPARMRLPAGRVIVLLLLVLVVGSSGVWAMLYQTKHRSPATPTPATIARSVPAWTATTGGPIYSSAAVANGVVYVGSSDGELYAFKADGCGQQTCSPLWNASTGNAEGLTSSSPVVVNGVVYIGSSDHKLYAFKADGCGQQTCSPLWTASTGDVIDSSAAVANGVVYVGSEDGKLYAFKADGCGQSTCSPLWTATTGNAITSSPAVANGVVYTGSFDHKLYAFKADGCGQQTCSPLWTASTGNARFSSSSSAAVANGVVYVGSADSNLYVFKADGCGQPTCPPLWTASTGDVIDSSPAVANGAVFIGSWDHKMYVFKADGCGQQTCSPLWTVTFTEPVLSSPVVDNGVVYIGSHDLNLYAYKADGCGQPTCWPVWMVTTNEPIDHSPAVANGVAYIGSEDGKLYAFQRK